MSLRTKIQLALGAALVLSLGALLLRHVKPLIPATALEVTYSSAGEDFRGDARVYRPLFRKGVYYLHLPKAASAHRWWVVDLASSMVYWSDDPRRFLFFRFVLRQDAPGIPLNDTENFSGWQWQFSQEGLSFAGEGLTCIARRR
jgi:hypothetical protein